MSWNLPDGCTDADVDRAAPGYYDEPGCRNCLEDCCICFDPKQPWLGHPREAEFERSFAAHEAAMAACICEWDGGYGDDGSECRRTPKRGCPTHAEEDEDA
jgi:hypothetical protein